MGAARPQVKKELKAAVRAYVLRHASLDNALLDTIRRRHFDWGTDMRRMMDAVQVTRARVFRPTRAACLNAQTVYS